MIPAEKIGAAICDKTQSIFATELSGGNSSQIQAPSAAG